MKKLFFRYWRVGVVFSLVALCVAGWLAFPPYRNLEKEAPVGNFTADELFQGLAKDPAGGYIRLSGKVIIIEGVVAASGDGYVMLGKDMCVIRCTLRKTIYDKKRQFEPGKIVILKGVCRGMNMTEVVVSHCIVINNSAK